MQRLKSTEMLDSLMHEKNHPLIRETKRECLEDHWDIDGVMQIIHGIRAGSIKVREVCTDVPSPMSLPLQWQVEAAEMYEYAPSHPVSVRLSMMSLNTWRESGPRLPPWRNSWNAQNFPRMRRSCIPC